MPTVTYAGAAYQGASGESVLDTLLRHGVSVSNSCRAGACQSCLMRSGSGAIPPVAQRGLKSTLIEQGYFLSCVCEPEGDLVVEPAGGLEIEARIASLERLTPTVLRARLTPLAEMAYRPGQYVTLRRGDGLSRSYSLAGLPEDGTLELHVRRAPHGRMSGWLFDEAREGEAVSVRGPAGDCFYTAGKPEQPLLLAGTGTGLAPLAGICRDALRHGHTGPIHLYHGARKADDLYLQEELGALAALHANLRYEPVVVPDGGSLEHVVGQRHSSFTGWRGFVCGNPAMVPLLKKKLFLAGMASREIFADAFLEAPAPRA
jgi:CDP-4-dehydro-6-deoxyglucose reductase